MESAPSWELHWWGLLTNDELFWPMFGLINVFIPFVFHLLLVRYWRKKEERKEKLMDKRIDRLYKKMSSLVKEMQSMKAKREENAQNHEEISSMEKIVEAMVSSEETSSEAPSWPQTTN
jgi:hypothetical protein